MTALRSVLTEPFDATKRQADQVLRADTVFRLECGNKALAWSERPAPTREETAGSQ